MKVTLNKPIRDEKGQALILAVILLLVGSLIIVPLLAFMGTGIKTELVYEEKAADLYAADAGIEDGMWQIRYDHLDTKFPTYDPYDFATSYVYTDPIDINDRDVNVTITNIWIPTDFQTPNGIPAPSDPDDARAVIEGSGGNSPKLLISGISAASTFKIRITSYFTALDGLKIKTLGIWLPPGFTYGPSGWDEATDPDPSNLNSTNIDYDLEIQSYASGQAIIWDFGSSGADFAGTVGPPAEDPFPGVDLADNPMICEITFPFDGPANQSPEAVPWVDTNLNLNLRVGGADIRYTWDADAKVYKIISEAHRDLAQPPNTTIEAYTTKSEIRKLSSAVAGDFFATGNSLIGGSGHPPDNYHYQLYNSTQASISTSDDPSSGIPADATIAAAYLYWTGWIDWHDYDPVEIFYDNCDNFVSPPVSWTAGSHWSYTSTFRGQGGYASGNDVTSDTYSLAAYAGKVINLSLYIYDSNAESGDYLYYQFYNSSGWSSPQTIYVGNYSSGTYTVPIPEAYLTANFRMRFTVDFSSTNEYVYLNDITIAPGGLTYPSNPTAENIAGLVEDTARVNKVLFNDTPVTADAYEVLYPEQFDGTDFEGTWFYTAVTDVTDLVYQWIEDGDIESNGAGNYTLGHYYVGTNPSADNYRVNAEDPSYSFDFYSGGGSTGYPLGTPSPSSYPSFPGGNRYTAAHCGWSLLTIYTSPETYGHQLYLYDIQSPNFDFFFGWRNNADFDNDGNPGGTVSGFLVPEQIAGETLAGRITVFVGEGDAGYTQDYFRVNGVNMSNSASPANNVWNSNSPGLTVSGVDIDPFDITWASGILSTGDTSVQIDIPTGTVSPNTDGFSMVYMILSFRSEVTSGGTLTYLISG